MRRRLTVVNGAIIAVFFSQSFNSQAKAEIIFYDELRSSDVLKVGAANGLLAEDISQLIGEFEGVSAFESKRMKEESVDDIIASITAMNQSGLPIVEITYQVPISQFNFEENSFATCLPIVLDVVEDVPVNGDMSLSAVIDPALRSASVAQANPRSGRNNEKRPTHPVTWHRDLRKICQYNMVDDFVLLPIFEVFPIFFSEVSAAEAFDGIVEGSNGLLTAQLRCVLERFEPVYDRLQAICRPLELSMYALSDFGLQEPVYVELFTNN